MPIATINPATGETLKTFNAHTSDEVSQKLDTAVEAYRAWRLTSFADRSSKMRRAGQILIERKEELGRLMTTEMGGSTPAESGGHVIATYREIAVRFGVHLQHDRATGEIRRGFRHFRCSHLARPAPCRPEIHQHGNTRRARDLVELRHVDVDRFGKWRQRLFARTAAAFVGEAAGRNAVRLSAMRARTIHDCLPDGCRQGWTRFIMRPSHRKARLERS